MPTPTPDFETLFYEQMVNPMMQSTVDIMWQMLPIMCILIAGTIGLLFAAFVTYRWLKKNGL